MENNQELLKVLENQTYIIIILASLCGIKIFLGISTIIYLFYPNIESAMIRDKIELEMEDMNMKICIDRADDDQMISNMEKQLPILNVVDETETKTRETKYKLIDRELKIDRLFSRESDSRIANVRLSVRPLVC